MVSVMHKRVYDAGIFVWSNVFLEAERGRRKEEGVEEIDGVMYVLFCVCVSEWKGSNGMEWKVGDMPSRNHVEQLELYSSHLGFHFV